MKQTSKKIIIVALIALVTLALAAGAYCLLGGDDRKEEPTAGTVEESPYTCTWKKQGSRTVTLQISGELPPNAQWSIGATDGILKVSRQKDTTVFKVKALAKGTGLLILSLRQTGIPVQLGADFHFCFSVDKRKNITFKSGEINLMTADTATAPDGQLIYTDNGAAGSLFVTVSGTDWLLTACSGLEYAGPTVAEEATRLELIALPEEDTKMVTLIKEQTGQGFTLVLTQKDGALAVAECIVATATPAEEVPAQPDDPEYEAFLAQLEKAKTQQERETMIAAYWAQQEKSTQTDNIPSAKSGEADSSAQSE